jgi:hypothetical protein
MAGWMAVSLSTHPPSSIDKAGVGGWSAVVMVVRVWNGWK